MTTLTTSATAQIGPDGRVVISIGPTVYGVTWRVTRVSINSDSVDQPTFRLYKNAETPSMFQDGSRTGKGDSSETDIQLFNLDKLICVWEGGTPGTNVGVFIQGEQSGV